MSGKGVGAALLMANIQAALRTRLSLGQDLASLARELDRDIEASTPGPVYATLFVGIFDPVDAPLAVRQRRAQPAVRHSRATARSSAWSRPGCPIGLLSGHGYTEQRVAARAGDLLFFYTDGCVEAENDAGDMFGTERLEAALMAALAGDDILVTRRGRDHALPRRGRTVRRRHDDGGDGRIGRSGTR